MCIQSRVLCVFLMMRVCIGLNWSCVVISPTRSSIPNAALSSSARGGPVKDIPRHVDWSRSLQPNHGTGTDTRLSERSNLRLRELALADHVEEVCAVSSTEWMPPSTTVRRIVTSAERKAFNKLRWQRWTSAQQGQRTACCSRTLFSSVSHRHRFSAEHERTHPSSNISACIDTDSFTDDNDIARYTCYSQRLCPTRTKKKTPALVRLWRLRATGCL